MKAERNKTIDFLPEDAPEYLARCLRVTEDVPLDTVCGRTICGDTFQVAPPLPRGFADLLIVDPPYNLTKDFSGGGFRRTTDANYAAFTRAWIELLLPLLKPDASVYVCCDWRSSPVIGLTLRTISSCKTASPGSGKRAAAHSATGKTAWRTSGSPHARTTTRSTWMP